jgi:hypothetical protein
MSVFIQDGVATLLFIAAAALLLQQTLGVVGVRPAARRCAACQRGQCATAPDRPARRDPPVRSGLKLPLADGRRPIAAAGD